MLIDITIERSRHLRIVCNPKKKGARIKETSRPDISIYFLSDAMDETPAQASQSTHGILRKLLHDLDLEKCSRYLPGYPCAFSKSISHNILRILLYPSAPLGTSPRHFGSAQYIAPLGTASLDCETWART